jgi:hypothetical protein
MRHRHGNQHTRPGTRRTTGRCCTASPVGTATLAPGMSYPGISIKYMFDMPETDMKDHPDLAGAPTRRHRRCSARVVSTGLRTRAAPFGGAAVRSVP